MKLSKNIPALFLVILMILGSTLLGGCSSAQTEKRKQLREFFKEGNYKEGQKVLDSKELRADEKSFLLFYMEKGLIHHAAGEYYLSVQYFEKAKELAKKLFTVSISKKVASSVANDTVDNYYGALFEHSLIQFYLGLNHYLLFQSGQYETYVMKDLEPLLKKGEKDLDKIVAEKILSPQEKQRELVAARSEILEWDSLLNAKKDDRRGSSVFKDDMLAKIFGGLIHEAFATPNDEQVALQLYQDAKEILLKNYNAYRTFNSKFIDFKKNYSKFHEMDLSKVKEDYVTPTYFQDELVQFINYKILRLTKKIRPQEFKKMVDRHQIDPKIVSEVEKLTGPDNIGVILQLGMIPEKISDKYNIGLEGAMRQVEDPNTRKAIMGVGVPILSAFAANTLGLVPDQSNWSMPGAVIGIAAANVAIENIGISFELPKIVNTQTQEKVTLEVYDKEGKKIRENPLVVLNPLGDIAEEAVAEDSAGAYTRVGVRVALKHITAIIAAYATYKVLAGQSEMATFMAKNVALFEYIAASKAIEASEKADVRYWCILPKDVRMAQFYLPKGEYRFKAKVKSTLENGPEVTKDYDLGALMVENEDSKKILNYRINKISL